MKWKIVNCFIVCLIRNTFVISYLYLNGEIWWKEIPIHIATFSQEINRLIYVTCINKNVGNLKENLRKFPKPKQAAGMSST